MTQTAVDPFSAPSGDPFSQPAQGGGTFPKVQELISELVMLTPKLIENVPDNFNKGKMVDRLTADLVVLTGERAGQAYPDMWFQQAPITKAGRKALDDNQRMILGRLRRFPVNEDVKAGTYPRGDWQAIETALLNWRPGTGVTIRFAVALDRYDEDDAAIARNYLNSKSPVDVKGV
jgi:hypothetical protein